MVTLKTLQDIAKRSNIWMPTRYKRDKRKLAESIIANSIYRGVTDENLQSVISDTTVTTEQSREAVKRLLNYRATHPARLDYLHKKPRNFHKKLTRPQLVRLLKRVFTNVPDHPIRPRCALETCDPETLTRIIQHLYDNPTKVENGIRYKRNPKLCNQLNNNLREAFRQSYGQN